MSEQVRSNLLRLVLNDFLRKRWLAFRWMNRIWPRLPVSTMSACAVFLAFHVNRLQVEGAGLPYRVPLGVVPLEGLIWPNKSMWGAPERALEASFEYEFTIDTPDEAGWTGGLHSAWSGLREAFGQPPVSLEQFEKDLVTR